MDRLILGDRDPYRPVYLLRFVRLQYAWAVSMMIVVAFVGFLVWSGQQQDQRDCVARNAQNQVSRKVLAQLTEASHADHDGNAELVWRQWADLVGNTPQPPC